MKIILLFLLGIISCGSQYQLDNIKGSSDHGMTSPDLTVNDVKIEFTEKFLKLQGPNETKIAEKLGTFADKKENESVLIHYGILKSCDLEINEVKSNQPLVVALIDPVSSKEYFLELNFPAGQPNSLLPRSKVKSELAEYCNQVKAQIKEDLEKAAEIIKKLIDVNKQKEKVEEDNLKQVPTQNDKPFNNEELKNKKSELATLEDKLKELEKKLADIKAKGDQLLKTDATFKNALGPHEQNKKKLVDEIGKIQAELKKLNDEKLKLEEKLKQLQKGEDPNLKNNNDVLDQKKRDKDNLRNQIKEVEAIIASKSQQVLELQKKIKETENKISDAKREMEALSKDNDISKLVNEIYNITSKCKQINDKLQEKKGQIPKLSKDAVDLDMKKKEFLKNQQNLMKNKEDEKKLRKTETTKLLYEMDKCFNFKRGFIDQANESFISDSKEGINNLMAIQPNKGGFNLANKLFISANPNLCAAFKDAKRKERKQRKQMKKTKKAAKRLARKGDVGLIYSSTRVPKIIEYQPYSKY